MFLIFFIENKENPDIKNMLDNAWFNFIKNNKNVYFTITWQRYMKLFLPFILEEIETYKKRNPLIKYNYRYDQNVDAFLQIWRKRTLVMRSFDKYVFGEVTLTENEVKTSHSDITK
jgi:hypothetical protein